MKQDDCSFNDQTIHTDGGVAIGGDVNTNGGTFVGRDLNQVVVIEQQDGKLQLPAGFSKEMGDRIAQILSQTTVQGTLQEIAQAWNLSIDQTSQLLEHLCNEGRLVKIPERLNQSLLRTILELLENTFHGQKIERGEFLGHMTKNPNEVKSHLKFLALHGFIEAESCQEGQMNCYYYQITDKGRTWLQR
jgi:predicted transcriptional regulator